MDSAARADRKADGVALPRLFRMNNVSVQFGIRMNVKGNDATLAPIVAYLRNCANTANNSAVWKSQGPREKTSAIKKSGGEIIQSA